MNNSADIKLRVGIKYFGGCNPEYDRVGLVAQIKKELEGAADFLSPDTTDLNLILAVQGCATACADLSTVPGQQIRLITCIEDGERFIKEILACRIT